MELEERRLSGKLAGLLNDVREEPTIGELVGALSERGFGILLVLISLPSALPIPAVGYSIPFGLLIALLGLQLIWGRAVPWLPERLCKRAVPRLVVPLLADKGIQLLRRIERFLKPRVRSLNSSVIFRGLIGLFVLVMGTLMMIPVPGTNTLPGLTILLIGLGLVENDGLLTIIGLLFGVTVIGLYLTALLLGGGIILRLFG